MASNERLELWATIGSRESYKELVEVNEALVDSVVGSLNKLVAIEVSQLTEEFCITEKDATESGSAFPHLQGTEVELDESIIDYCTELVSDVVELTTIPAISIADELENWLDELAEYHRERRVE
ncbi:MAG: hypothetical protein ACR2NF_09965 [Pirellulales bacterium]